MKVLAGTAVAAFVAERGGQLYVRTDTHRCCSGATTYLVTSTAAHEAEGYVPHGAPGFVVWFERGVTPPDELHLEIKGFRRRRLEAYWNGCAFKI